MKVGENFIQHTCFRLERGQHERGGGGGVRGWETFITD